MLVQIYAFEKKKEKEKEKNKKVKLRAEFVPLNKQRKKNHANECFTKATNYEMILKSTFSFIKLF